MMRVNGYWCAADAVARDSVGTTFHLYPWVRADATHNSPFKAIPGPASGGPMPPWHAPGWPRGIIHPVAVMLGKAMCHNFLIHVPGLSDLATILGAIIDPTTPITINNNAGTMVVGRESLLAGAIDSRGDQ